ncbi:TonB-dependent receptor [Ideonella sp. DXS29W]|uniref:TonB-dependent receptor n=1 Tax=Ideonella lacteola TaxID=2984193 RepID=A0ABU9BWQ8_9BURK
MFQRKKLCTHLLLAFGVLPAYAQDASTQRVEITGSSIRRIEAEGALPITVISRDAIEKSSASSVTELIQALPAMTGGNFQQSSGSVNGNGFGNTTAAIHALDQKYTLVLLNGRRVAPFAGFGASGGDGAVNLASLPLDAVERVEVLTDGASALYGSDAIAGVVNFITKKDLTQFGVFFNGSAPQEKGGNKWSAGISKGFGSLDSDGFNLLASYSHDVQEVLWAKDRDFSKKGGLITFNLDGKRVVFDQTSSNSLPGSVYLDSGNSFSPYFDLNGDCGADPNVFVAGTKCRTNYAAMVQNLPESERDSFYLSGRMKLGDDNTLFAEALYSKFTMTAAFAPPAQPMGLGSNDLPGRPLDILWNKYIVPYQTANNDTSTGGQMRYRAMEAGPRTDDFVTEAQHYVLGMEGTLMGWDYGTSVVFSSNRDQDKLAGGYLDFNKFVDLIASGQYDPLVPKEGQNLDAALLSGTFLKSTSTQNVFNLHGSKDMFAMPGGNSVLGVGFDYAQQTLKQETSDLAQFGNGTPGQAGKTNYAVGGFYGYVPMEASRNNYGLFAELLMPVAKKTEVTASVRYDHYDRVHNSKPFTQVANNLEPLPAEDQGNTFSHATYKLSFRLQPVDGVLVRGSLGTGFKAPSVNQIAAPLAFATNTSGSYVCPFPTEPVCIANGTGPQQWDLISAGNPAKGKNGLKAESSRQWTLGGRWEPADTGLSMGLDYWSVRLKDQILNGMPEGYAFANASSLQDLFVAPYQDPAGYPTVALIQKPFNAGKANYQGLDWEFDYRTTTSIGKVSASLGGTHMLKADYELPGGKQSDLGKFGGDNNVVFRNIMRLTLGLQYGDFTHTLTAKNKSGYKDQAFTAESGNVYDEATGDGVAYNGKVRSYTLVDWQTRWQFSADLRFTVGITNLFDEAPPRSLKLVGGNQVGYDGRYTDPTGRAFTAGVSYRF